uniref:Uncharacterized protein n=1 Tax=Sphaeramia orbicularis TaxID=375764 RepID=A0A672ZPT3_9TELE
CTKVLFPFCFQHSAELLSWFSVDSGMALIRKGELTIVSGAPRGGYSGKVAFLKPDPVAKRNLSVEFLLTGPGLASSFGYDVAVVDLNGDGYIYFRTYSSIKPDLFLHSIRFTLYCQS